jgi:hypothetical protein
MKTRSLNDQEVGIVPRILSLPGDDEDVAKPVAVEVPGGEALAFGE